MSCSRPRTWQKISKWSGPHTEGQQAQKAMQEPCLPIKDPEDHVANLSSQGNPILSITQIRQAHCSKPIIGSIPGTPYPQQRTTPAQTWCTISRVYPFDTSSSHSSYHLTCLNHVQAVYYCAVLCRPFACDLSTLNAQGPGHASVLHCSPSKQEVLLTGPSGVECHILDAVWSEPPPSL